jgi:hypothetical protein
MGSGYQLMKSIRVGDGACGVEENGNQRRKKKERRDEEERGWRPMYNTRASAPLVPLLQYKVPGRPVPSWWDSGPGPRPSSLMAPYSCTRAPTALGGGGQEVLGCRCQEGRHKAWRPIGLQGH